MGTATIQAIKRRVPYRLRDLLRPKWPSGARSSLEATFSQTGEDRIVRHVFDVMGVPHPTYLDIGAFHPFTLSNTALFSLTGSTGINIEPDPRAYAAFLKHRPSDVNLNVGCAETAGTLPFYRMSAPTLSTFDRASAESASVESGGKFVIESVERIEVRPVADILIDVGWCPDFVSIDVEGLDLAILRTMPDWLDRPTVLCVESATYSEIGGSRKVPEVGALARDLGYREFADTWINTIFIRTDRWVH